MLSLKKQEKKKVPFKKKYKNSRDEWIGIALLCAPAIIHLLIFWLPVQVETIRMAFTNYTTGEINFSNFEWAINKLAGDVATSELALALKNTLIFFVKGCLMLPLNMFFAYLIFRRVPGHSFMRLALYLPGAVSSTMMALIYAKIMESDGMLMTRVQEWIGSSDPIMLKVSNGVLYVLLFDVLIGVGGGLIIYLGGMSRIPNDLIEYGKLEGIGPFREFASVVLPLIWPTVVTMVSLQIIGVFGASGSILILTDGQYGTNTLAFWMYNQVKNGHLAQYHRVSALGFILTACTIPLVVIFRTIMNKFGEEVEY